MTAGEDSAEATVLFFAHEEETGAFLTRLLEDEGYRVLNPADYDAAMELLLTEQVDLVVADADLDGLATEGILRARQSVPGLRQIPALVVTGGLSHQLLDSFNDTGVAYLIQKPVQANEFLGKVQRVLRASRREIDAGGTMPVELVRDDARAAGIGDAVFEVLAAIPAWLMVVDGELRMRYANRSFLEFRALDLDEVEGIPLSEALLPGMVEADEAIEAVREVLVTGHPRTIPTVRFHTEAGGERAVDFQVTPFEIRGDPHALVILHDVSEHWYSWEQMKREKRKLEEIVDGMGASLAVLDPELRVVWANRTFHIWFGEMWGQRFDLALRGIVLVGDTDPQRIFTGREHISKEWAHYTADGDKRYYRNIILPSHDSSGALKELVLVTQDLTEATLRSEQHRLLQDLANLMQSTLDLDRLLYIILTCATEGHALGFNRAFIFLTDSEGRELRGRMGVGPSSQQEAFVIWAELAGSKKSLLDLTSDDEKFEAVAKQPLTRMVRKLNYPLAGKRPEKEIMARTVLENRVQVVHDAVEDPRVTERFRSAFGCREFVVVPLQSKGTVLGALLADNVFSNRSITSEQIQMLELFAAPAGLAIDNGRTYAELKRSMDRLEQAQDALIHSERLATVGRLAAHVAHEIRNPLSTIGGFAASVLKKPEDLDRVKRSSAIIYEEVQRLEQILSGVMDFTRPRRLDREIGQVNDLIVRLADTMGPELALHGVTVNLELAEDLPECPFDRKQLHQALFNLMRNAVESMTSSDESEDDRVLTLRSGLEGDRIFIDVEDNGVGVPADILPRIFEPFSSGKVSGTGLGLAVVRKILLDHGGDVILESEPGEGARFRLHLPREAVSPPHLSVGEGDTPFS